MVSINPSIRKITQFFKKSSLRGCFVTNTTYLTKLLRAYKKYNCHFTWQLSNLLTFFLNRKDFNTHPLSRVHQWYIFAPVSRAFTCIPHVYFVVIHKNNPYSMWAGIFSVLLAELVLYSQVNTWVTPVRVSCLYVSVNLSKSVAVLIPFFCCHNRNLLFQCANFTNFHE